MKIAIFHLGFIYSGGGEKLVLEEARGLRNLGHSVEIFTPVVNEKKCFPEILEKEKIKTFLPRISLFTAGHESFYVLLTCILVPFFAYRFKGFDVILAANQPSPWIAWIIKKMYGVPYVSYLAQPTRFIYPRAIDKETGLVFSKKASLSFSTKLMYLTKKFIIWADKVSIRDSNSILANGEYMRGVLDKVYKIQAVSCPAGAYPATRITKYELRIKGNIKIGKKTVNKPYLLITNRHFAQKRFEYAISAFASLLKDFPRLSLVITGEEAEYTEQLKTMIKQLSLDSKVKFLGLVKEKDLDNLYKSAAVYLYTAPEEDFGMGVIEAMAKGTPVVAWNKAGPSKIIESGKSGLLAEPFSVADFTEKIFKLLSKRELWNKIYKGAIRAVRQKFSYKSHLNMLESELKNAL